MNLGEMLATFVLFWGKWMTVYFAYGISKSYVKDLDWRHLSLLAKIWHWIKSLSIVVFAGLFFGYDDGHRSPRAAILIMAVLAVPVALGILDGRYASKTRDEFDE
jgi:hypothetical protein